MSIQLIPYNNIDKQKWDACITNASNGLVYAYSFYLDAMAKNWEALVLNDYEMVMPLTWKKKMGIAYLYTPPFVQQLGIFGQKIITKEISDAFVSMIKSKFDFAELFVNFGEENTQPNFVLLLNEDYDQLRKKYKQDLVKNLNHASKFYQVYTHSTNYKAAIQSYKNEYAARTLHVKQNDYLHFEQLCNYASLKKHLIVRKVVNNTNEVLAIALFLKDNKRLYNLMSTVTEQGRHTEANHFLFDRLIQEFSAQNLILDFEGSSIDGIANFYKKFGAYKEQYSLLRYNNLPWYFKWLKKSSTKILKLVNYFSFLCYVISYSCIPFNLCC